MLPTERLAQPLTLPGGAVLPNRLAKSAMAEGMGTDTGEPKEGLVTLYRRWGQGGAGLLITGNVMIDRAARGEPGDVVVEDEAHLDMLARWAAAAREGGAHAWVQLNHPGRQSLSPEPVAPSPVPMRMGFGMFKTPRALTENEIEDVIARFGRTAAIVKRAGFDGVQIHGAHGYLVSQFLSPLTNLRSDGWGGDAERRRRFVLAVVREVRRAVGPGYPVGIKLNSADFQRGGFSEEESMAVLEALDAEGLDAIEISGGTYESAAMIGMTDRSRAREAYFQAYAERVRDRLRAPLMVTGGFRTLAGMSQALESGAVDLVGLARPLAVEPDLPKRLIAGAATESRLVPPRVGIKDLDSLLQIIWYQAQLKRMGHGRDPDLRLSPWWVLAEQALRLGPELFRPKRS
ncbi:MAG: NADH:flavin oxidoreductase/NADH oxidase family protein [Candidatus Sericytochromatia bacterium]